MTTKGAKSLANTNSNPPKTSKANLAILDRLAEWALYYSTQMIHQANNRTDAQKGDPKIGGHPAACASSTHLLGALHLFVRKPQDFLAVKPHASPMDHAYGHLLGLFRHRDGERFTTEEAKKVMFNLRKFMDPSWEKNSPEYAPAFQSYHAAWDPDAFGFFPSGSVGIPPVVSAYTALAFRFAEHHGFKVPKSPHFWSIIGDSEFREGSLSECMPDVAERALHNVTWIVDYNRQNLDGTRILNEHGISGTDSQRIEKMAAANGWEVLQCRHGRLRKAFFQKPGGTLLKEALEDLSDFELQALMAKRDHATVRERFSEIGKMSGSKELEKSLQDLPPDGAWKLLTDLGGHDFEELIDAMEHSRKSSKPTLIIAHTLKGWNLECAAQTGNHSILVSDEEIAKLQAGRNLPDDDLFGLPTDKDLVSYMEARGAELRAGITAIENTKKENLERLRTELKGGEFPTNFGINLKFAPWANTQWMWGQIAAKLIRIANANTPDARPEDKSQLTEEEARWLPAAGCLVTMAPDVGTSTNLNPTMDGKIYGPPTMEDFESRYKVKDKRRPDLVPLEKQSNRHLRFEIEESNAMSCLGAFGKMMDHVGVPFLPLMTIYDFFIKRALDQYFYNVYWQSGFILVGTPSGVTLSPEGAQHSWKSDLQIPNGITWEPSFAMEMDWIIADAVRRHFTRDNLHREGVLIRAVTRGVEQKLLLDNLKAQRRFADLTDEAILEATRKDVLQGGYWLVHHEGAEDYAPGDNVVHIAVMGALVPEAVEASKTLYEKQGIYANILVVTSPDLLLGTLGRETGFQHLRKGLGVNGNLHLHPVNGETISTQADFLAIRGSRIPIVAVCDGEPGLLDNMGSIVGVPQDTLAVRKHSKSGRPVDVYQYHHLDPQSISEAAILMLEQAADEEMTVSSEVYAAFRTASSS